MNPLTAVLVLQLAVPATARPAAPVLSFPDPSLDDTAAYQGYRTRFFQDAARNTVQIYVDNRSGRVVHLLADAENESIGLTVRDRQGRSVWVDWGGDRATVFGSPRSRTLVYDLEASAPAVSIGKFLLGSMRVERDFQYGGRHKTPFASPPFVLPEMERLIAALNRLDAPTRTDHLATLNAARVEGLRARLQPTVTVSAGASWVARVVQPSLDARDTLALELRVDPARVVAAMAGDSIVLVARSGRAVRFTLAVSTTGRALTPLARNEIFNDDFLRFLAQARRDSAAPNARWLERQVRGVQLLSSREKLMAGLPAYATYFGRDMLVSALMMRPIWRADMSAFVVASVLRKLSPAGDVSHEEALGGQAVREAAGEYAALVDSAMRSAGAGQRAEADRVLARARDVLAHHRRVRENYHMIDDELQLPVLAARWLSDAQVPAARKRAFLVDSSDGGGTRVVRLARELALVARMTAPYVADPVVANLISFAPRDSGWASASWRDSNEGYAGGRFAMDVNAIWAPHALESIGLILQTLRELRISVDSLARIEPGLRADTPLGRYARDSSALRRAIDAWRGATRHFLVRLSPADVRSRVAARLAAMPPAERDHWTTVVTTTKADQDSLVFLALSLDARGTPIGVANTDPGTGLFLGERERGGPLDSLSRAAVLRDVRLFTRAYPVGLLIRQVGPVIANDAYAPRAIWPAFERDRYHGPRVVWGREVNLFLLGVASHLAQSGPSSASESAYRRELRAAFDEVQRAVAASGFHSELWSYEIAAGGVKPVRYDTGSDVQLWSTTDLAVQFALWRMRR